MWSRKQARLVVREPPCVILLLSNMTLFETTFCFICFIYLFWFCLLFVFVVFGCFLFVCFLCMCGCGCVCGGVCVCASKFGLILLVYSTGSWSFFCYNYQELTSFCWSFYWMTPLFYIKRLILVLSCCLIIPVNSKVEWPLHPSKSWCAPGRHFRQRNIIVIHLMNFEAINIYVNHPLKQSREKSFTVLHQAMCTDQPLAGR